MEISYLQILSCMYKYLCALAKSGKQTQQWQELISGPCFPAVSFWVNLRILTLESRKFKLENLPWVIIPTLNVLKWMG